MLGFLVSWAESVRRTRLPISPAGSGATISPARVFAQRPWFQIRVSGPGVFAFDPQREPEALAKIGTAAVDGPASITMLAEMSAPPSVDRKSTRLNSSHGYISYAGFCLEK